MSTIAAIIGLVVSVFLAVIIIMAVPFLRGWAGLGNVNPTGAAAALGGIGKAA